MKRTRFEFQAEIDPEKTQVMIEQRERDRRVAKWLRLLAGACFLTAAGFIAVGVLGAWSVYANMINDAGSLGLSATGELPARVWCLYAGLPFLGVGLVLRIAGMVTTVRTK